MINCPKCQATSTVLQSRVKDNSMWRRRECKACAHRWSTREISQEEFAIFKAFRKARAKKIRQTRSQAAQTRRGFIVPEHLQEHYNLLVYSTKIPSREAARMLGIIE